MEGVRCGTCQTLMSGGVCPKCSVQISQQHIVIAPKQSESFGFRCGVCGQGWDGFELTCPHCNGVEKKGGGNVK